MKLSELRGKPIYNLGKLVLVFLLTGLTFYLAIKAAGLLLPFVLALLCAMMMEPLIKLLCRIHIRKHHLPRSVATIVTMLFAGGAVGIGLFFLIAQIVEQFVSLVQSIPGWANEISDQLNNFAAWVGERVNILPEDMAVSITEEISSLLSTLIKSLSGVVDPLARGVWSTARMVPLVILSIFMFIIGTFYMASWRPRMAKFMDGALPEAWMSRIRDIKKKLFSTLWGYIRAQLLLLLAVFIIILVGLSILRVEYALVIALIIALFDALPVIGSGVFLNTWAVYTLITGDIPMALGLFLTYIAVVIGRNLLEPRLVSVQIGLPPLLTMAAMYAGFRLFGVLGLIGGPILVVVMRIVYEYYAQGRTLRQILTGEPPPERAEKEPPAAPPDSA